MPWAIVTKSKLRVRERQAFADALDQRTNRLEKLRSHMLPACVRPVRSASCGWRAGAVFVLALGLGATLYGQNQQALHNADIVSMATAHLSAEAIVLKIETSSVQFDTSPDALAVLKAAGVPDVAIEAMIKASARTPTSPTSPRAASPAGVSAAVGHDGSKATVYIYRPGKFFGKTLEPSVFLDEQKLLDMDNARYLALKLDPGRHVLRSNEKNSEIDQAWDAGQTYYVKSQ